MVIIKVDFRTWIWPTKHWGWGQEVAGKTGKTQCVLFDRNNNFGAIDLKSDGFVLKENASFKILDYHSFLNWIGALTLFLLLKLSPRKSQPWFVLWSFFLLSLLLISWNLLYDLAWNAAVMLLTATWIWQISYRNGHVGLLVLHLLPLLNP